MENIIPIEPHDNLRFFIDKGTVAICRYQSNGTYELEFNNAKRVYFDLRDVISLLRTYIPNVEYEVLKEKW